MITTGLYQPVLKSISLLPAGTDFGLLTGPHGLTSVIGNALIIASTAAGVVSVIFLVIGGIRYIASGGSEQGIKGAKDTVFWAIIGLVVSISAYGLVTFIIQRLTT